MQTMPSNQRQALLIASSDRRETVWGGGRQEEIAHRTRLAVCEPGEFLETRNEHRDTSVIFSTWGMPTLSPAHLDALPHLRAVFYAAGTVQSFARPLLERGIVVVSAWRANAVPVAEFTLAQILLSLKGYFRNVQEYRTLGYNGAHRGAGAYGATVALLGAGAVGRRVIELLRPFQVRVIVFDSFLSDADATQLGVEKVSLANAFARGAVVSNHLANNEQTKGLIDAALLSSLPPGATFLNTGRGQTVRENDLVQVFLSRPDLTALLDVTVQEPIGLGSSLWGLPNVQISTHIAGAIGDETRRMADLCIEEFDRWERGEPLQHQVTLEMLATMA